MAVFGRDQLNELAKKPAKIKLIDVPEWGEGCQVYIRAMTGTELNSYQASVAAFKPGQSSPTANLDNALAKLAVRVICDDAGTRLYADTDLALVGKLPADGLMRINREANALNRLGPNALADEVKNSESSPTT